MKYHLLNVLVILNFIFLNQISVNATRIKKLFARNNLNLILDFNCDSYSNGSLEAFKPDLLINDKLIEEKEIKFSISMTDDADSELPFEMKRDGIVYWKRKISKLTAIRDRYYVKLVAISHHGLKDELLLNIKVNKNNNTLNGNCFNKNTDNTSDQIKILFADSLFSDFNQLIFENIDANNSYSVALDENIQIESFICYILVKTRSPDSALEMSGNGKEKFRLDQVDYGSTSFVHSSSHIIAPLISLYSLKLESELDRENIGSYELKFSIITVTKAKEDNEIIDKTLAFAILNVILNDINDNAPIFEKLSYKFEIIENNFKNSCIGYVKANDLDLNQNGIIKYSIINSTFKVYKEVDLKLKQDDITSLKINEIFFLNEKTGQICVLFTLDRECYSKYSFEVTALDQGSQIRLASNKSALVEINVIDVNDNAPIFYEQDKEFENGNKCFLTKQTQSINRVKQSETKIKLDQKYPQYFVQENAPANTFIAWIKAFDLDENENSQIDYYLEVINSENKIFNTQNYYEEHFFNIDTNGIIRSLVSFHVLNKTKKESTSIEIDDSKVSLHKTNFLLKVTAKDRGKPSLLNEIIINIKVLNQKENVNKLNLTLMPNQTTLWIEKNADKNYDSPLVKIILNDGSNISNNRALFQLIPFVNKNNDLSLSSNETYLDKEFFEYGKTCDQTDIIKYFSLSKNGEISLSSYIKQDINNSHLKNSTINYMICFVNVRVTDLNNFYQTYSNLEFTFIIYSNNLSESFNLQNETIRENLIEKVDKYKQTLNSIYKNKSYLNNMLSPFSSFSKNNQSASWIKSGLIYDQSLKINLYLFITSGILILAGLTFLLLNNVFLKRTKSSNLYCNHFLKKLKLIFNIKSSSKKSTPNDEDLSSKEFNSQRSSHSEVKRLESSSEVNFSESNSFKKLFKKSFCVKKSSTSSTSSNEKCLEKTKMKSSNNKSSVDFNSSLEIKDDTTNSNATSIQQNNDLIQLFSSFNQIENDEPKSSSITKSIVKSKNKEQEENDSVKSSLTSFLIKGDSIKRAYQDDKQIKHLFNSHDIKTSGIKAGGIYQVANQILIDYDDEAKHLNTNRPLSNLNKSNQNNKQYQDAEKKLEPLERFEKIYYKEDLSTNICISSSSIGVFNNNNSKSSHQTNKIPQSNFGSFV